VKTNAMLPNDISQGQHLQSEQRS